MKNSAMNILHNSNRRIANNAWSSEGQAIASKKKNVNEFMWNSEILRTMNNNYNETTNMTIRSTTKLIE